MASFIDSIDVDSVKSFLGINASDETFDDIIVSQIPFYYVFVKKLISVDYSILTDDDVDFLSGVVAAGIGCHLIVTTRDFGMKTSGYKVGNTSRQFVRRYKTDYLSWCEFFEDLITDTMSMYGELADLSSERPGVNDGYGEPY
jgi:hypothetical protein